VTNNLSTNDIETSDIGLKRAQSDIMSDTGLNFYHVHVHGGVRVRAQPHIRVHLYNHAQVMSMSISI
jgi:hypothetical protein